MITSNKNWGKLGKKHKSTNNAISNDGSSIEIIDQSHGLYYCRKIDDKFGFSWPRALELNTFQSTGFEKHTLEKQDINTFC